MAAGYLFNGQCFASHAGASSAYHSVIPVGLTPGATSYILQKDWDGSAWVVKHFSLSSGVLTLHTTTVLPSVDFPVCDTAEHFMDGLTLGWGVAGAVLLSALVMAMRRGLP